jgi:hypothetical protein
MLARPLLTSLSPIFQFGFSSRERKSARFVLKKEKRRVE